MEIVEHIPNPDISDYSIVKAELSIESQVTVHCKFIPMVDGERMRIWPSIYLKSQNDGYRAKLVSLFNMSLAPKWTTVTLPTGVIFTMIFEGLPKSCEKFDLVEPVSPNPLLIKNISRNKNDVYFLDVPDDTAPF